MVGTELLMFGSNTSVKSLADHQSTGVLWSALSQARHHWSNKIAINLVLSISNASARLGR